MRLPTFVVLLLGLLALRAGAGEPRGFDPRFRRGLPEDVLAKEAPALRRGDVEAVRALLEAGFAMAVPEDRAKALEATAETAWPTLDVPARRAFLELAAPLAELRRLARAGDRAGAEKGLAAWRRELDAYLAAREGRALAKELAGTLRLCRAEAWPGNPAIHAAAADAWLQLVTCLVAFGRNEDVQPTEGQRSVVFEDLRREFRELDPATRRRVLEAYRPWLRLQATWLEGDAVRRLALRFTAVKLLAGALREEDRITLGPERDMVAYARAATVLRSLQTDYEAVSNLARRPDAVLDAVEAWLAEGGATTNPRPLLE